MGKYSNPGWYKDPCADGEGYQWNPGAFNDQGEVLPEFLGIQDPSNHNCGLCHGLVHDNVEEPLITLGCAPERWSTITTGQIISPQKMSDSGMNLARERESWIVPGMYMQNGCSTVWIAITPSTTRCITKNLTIPAPNT